MTEVAYPYLIDRAKAVVADYVLILALLAGVSTLYSNLGVESNSLKMGTFCFIFVFYDPLMTTLIGGTVGHRLNNLKVVREGNRDRKLNLVWAVFRFFLKSLLGFISFFTVNGHPQKRAVHDLVASSVVVFIKPPHPGRPQPEEKD